MQWAIFFSACMCVMSAHGADLMQSIPDSCRQLVVMIAPTWTSSSGALQQFARADRRARWEPVGKSVPVLIGERGLGWGLGLHELPKDDGPRKVEGDRRAPAGIFRLTAIFGTIDHKELPPLKLRFQAVTPALEAVDDPASRFYNRIVDRARVSEPDWHSSERMAAIPDYGLGIVVAHNPENSPGAGSCIFLHLWLGERRGTLGCTALRRADLIELVSWLEAKSDPVLIQLPREAAQREFAELLK